MRHPLIGRTLAGKFTLESLIGSGAMGEVFRARHVALDGFIAVKVMHKEIAAEETFAQRFHREARAASRLDHTNVIRVIDFGTEPDGSLYIVMEYVDGPDLFQVMKAEGPLPQERIVAVMTQVLSGVAAAHDTGVIHRDLKPENIMISTRTDDDGATHDVVKVCDFGIAQLSDPNPSGPRSEGQRTLTTRGVLLGTPQYMSPEQARGDSMDARTDVYSAGVILYQMLADQLPFDGATPIDIVLKHISEDPVPPSNRRPGISPHLESVCLKALSKRRESRYVSAREMRAALRADGLTPVVSSAAVRQAHSTLPSAGAPGPEPTRLDLTRGTGDLDVDVAAFRPELKRSLLYASTVLGLALLVVPLFFAFGDGNGETAVAPRPLESVVPSVAARENPPPDRSPEAPRTPAASPEQSSRPVESPAPRASKAQSVRRAVEAAPHRIAEPVAEQVMAATDPLRAPESAGVADGHEPQVATSPPTPSEHAAQAPAGTNATASRGGAPSSTTVRPDSGRVIWHVAAVGGGATAGGVMRALSRPAKGFTSCYQNALRARGRAVNGEGTLRLVCDDQGRVVSATLSGTGMPEVAACIRGLVTGITIPNADTGEAWATIAMTLAATE